MKFTVYELDGTARGDFTAIASPMWTMGGSKVVTPGGSIKVAIPDYVAEKEWLQFGCVLVTRPHADLPLWAGVLDPPWGASLPAQATLYNIEYLLNIRTPDASESILGSVDTIMRRMLEIANAQEEMFLRIGTVGSVDATQRQETIKQTKLWDQFQAFAIRTATEFSSRVATESGQLKINFDLGKSLGSDTNALLVDGDNGNMAITDAQVDGTIINRIKGVGTQSTTTSRLQGSPISDLTSVKTYRLRSAVQQFGGASIAEVNANTQTALESARYPLVKLNVKILNHQHIFKLLRLGNSFAVRASRLYLPVGVRAWVGKARIYAMTYSESDQSVMMTMTGQL